MTKNDFYIILVIIFLALSIYLKNSSMKNSPQALLVRKSGNIIFKLTLPAERIVEIKDGEKSWILEVKDYGVRVLKSDCPKKICKSQGRISQTYQSIICAPFKSQAEIEGGKSEVFVDAVTR